jgi:PAS domain-containing protein
VIAERHRAEEALLETELNSRLLLNSIPGLVCTMSPAGEVERFNPQILEYFGKTPEELKGWANSDAVHPDDVARVSPPLPIRSQQELPTTLSTVAVGRMAFIDGSRSALFPYGIPPIELPAGTFC